MPVIVPGAESRLTDAGVGRCRYEKAATEGRRRRREEEEEAEEAVKEEKNPGSLRRRFGEPKNGLQKWGGMRRRRRCSFSVPIPMLSVSTNADWV